MPGMQSRFFANPEAILGTLARLFAADGAAREVAVLTYSSPELVETNYDNWNGGTTSYSLLLHVPLNLYPQLQEGMGLLEQAILDKAQIFLDQFPNDHLTQVKIVPAVVEIHSGVKKLPLGSPDRKHLIKVAFAQTMSLL